MITTNILTNQEQKHPTKMHWFPQEMIHGGIHVRENEITLGEFCFKVTSKCNKKTLSVDCPCQGPDQPLPQAVAIAKRGDDTPSPRENVGIKKDGSRSVRFNICESSTSVQYYILVGRFQNHLEKY